MGCSVIVDAAASGNVAMYLGKSCHLRTVVVTAYSMGGL